MYSSSTSYNNQSCQEDNIGRCWQPYVNSYNKWSEVNWLFNATMNDISDIDVQADQRRWTYGRDPNVLDISKGSLTCPSKHRHGANLSIRLFST